MMRIDVVAKLVDKSMDIRIIEDFKMEARVRTDDLTGLDALRQLLGRGRKVEVRESAYRWRCRDPEVLLYLFMEVEPFVELKKDLVRAAIDYLRCDDPEGIYHKAKAIRRLRLQLDQA